MRYSRVASIALAGTLSACGLVLGIGDHEIGPASDADVDASMDGAGDGASSVDADGDVATADVPVHPDPGVFCYGVNCDPRTQACCHSCGGGSGCIELDATPSCSDPRNGCTVSWPCDDQTDCETVGLSGTVCCGSKIYQSTGVVNVSCQTLSDCAKTPHVVFCDPSAPTPCPNGAPCPLPEGGGFATCTGL